MNEILLEVSKILNPVKDLISKPQDFLTANMGSTFGITMLIVAIVGILCAFFGYRLLKPVVFFGGLAIGAYLGDMLLNTGVLDSILTEFWMTYVVMLVCGLIVAYLVFKVLKVGIILGVGYMIYLLINGFVSDFVLQNGLPSPEILGPVIAGLIGLLIGLIAIKLLKPVIMIVTAALGGALVAYAIAGLIPLTLEGVSMNVIVLAVIGLLGFAAQFATGRGKEFDL